MNPAARTPGQGLLFEAFAPSRFPQTRYQGSKRRLLGWIGRQVGDLPFDTVLDAFGGTGCVSYLFKCHGKQVTYNDVLACNHQVGTALIENDSERLGDTDLERIMARDPAVDYDDFIERTFRGIYFTDQENRWLDVAAQNIARLADRYRRALAYYVLFQACLAKRPYNLFHRKNLYMRTAQVRRGFGNKVTWDRSFEDHFRRAVAAANAAIIHTGRKCVASNLDATEVAGSFDLVYIDPPYVSARNVGVDYHGFYHFLEGLTDYAGWAARVDYASKHRRLQPMPSPWTRADTNEAAFRRLFRRYADSILVVSYRSDGSPRPERLAELLGEVKGQVEIVAPTSHQYALSKNRGSREILLIGR